MSCRRNHVRMGFVAGVVVLAFVPTGVVWADTFGTGDNHFQIEFVTIGNPGNPDDEPQSFLPPIGSVPNVYRIGTYEVSEPMVRKATAATAGTSDPLQLMPTPRGPDKPATSVAWIEMARFVNWLNTSYGYSPAYKFVRGEQPAPPLFGFQL